VHPRNESRVAAAVRGFKSTVVQRPLLLLNDQGQVWCASRAAYSLVYIQSSPVPMTELP